MRSPWKTIIGLWDPICRPLDYNVSSFFNSVKLPQPKTFISTCFTIMFEVWLAMYLDQLITKKVLWIWQIYVILLESICFCLSVPCDALQCKHFGFEYSALLYKTDIYMYLLILSYNSGADHRVGNGVDVGWWYCSFLLEKQSHVVILRSFCGITTNNIKFQ